MPRFRKVDKVFLWNFFLIYSVVDGLRLARLTRSDVESEVAHLDSAGYSFLPFGLGANPPFKHLEAFFDRLSGLEELGH